MGNYLHLDGFEPGNPAGMRNAAAGLPVNDWLPFCSTAPSGRRASPGDGTARLPSQGRVLWPCSLGHELPNTAPWRRVLTAFEKRYATVQSHIARVALPRESR